MVMTSNLHRLHLTYSAQLRELSAAANAERHIYVAFPDAILSNFTVLQLPQKVQLEMVAEWSQAIWQTGRAALG